MRANARQAFWIDFRKGMLPVIAIVLAVQLLEQFAWFRALDHAVLDTLTRFRAKPASRGIFIVAITESDYRDPELFDARSPLDPTVVLRLLKSIQHLEPAAIGVDLDTSGDEWRKVDRKEHGEVLDARNIVWAGVPTNDRPGEGDVLEIACPLGGDQIDKIDAGRQVGITLLPQDEDGVVRRHEAQFERVRLSCPHDPAKVPTRTFDMALFEQCRSDPTHQCVGYLRSRTGVDVARGIVVPALVGAFAWLGFDEREAKSYVSFADGAHSFQTIQSREFLKSATPAEGSERLRRLRSLVKDRVVLVGGTYASARDEYYTPTGRMPGVELFANGVQSAATGFVLPADWPPVRTLGVLIDLSMGAVVLVITLLRTHRFIALVPLLGLAVPLLLVFMLHDRALWLGVVPVGVGAALSALYEKFQALRGERNTALHERDEARREREELRAEVETKKDQLAACDRALSAAREQLALRDSPPEPPQSPSPPPDRSGSAPDAA